MEILEAQYSTGIPDLQMCEIGFQGDDPKTDFRGMGLLGLYNLQWANEEWLGFKVMSGLLILKYQS